MKTWAIGVGAALLCIGLAVATSVRDGAIIHNTGSTNFPGYTIKVWSDGSTWAVRSNKAGEPTGQPVTQSVPKELVQKLLADAKAAKLSGNAIGRPCMKSASFGSATVVQYHGWTSPDLECPGDGFVIALGSDAKKIAAALQIINAPTRRGLLPNEIRRPPESAPTQPAPTPESSPATP
jgi:hypothetical protein